VGYAGRSGRVYVRRFPWRNGAWEDWVGIDREAAAPPAIPTFVPRGGVDHGEALSIVEAETSGRTWNLRVTDSINGTWAIVPWYEPAPSLW
jgi:hypothetical protein